MASSAQPGRRITRHSSHRTLRIIRQLRLILPHTAAALPSTTLLLSQYSHADTSIANTIYHIPVIGHPSTATLHPHNFHPRALTLAHSSTSPCTTYYSSVPPKLLRALHYSRTFSNYRPKTAYHRHLSSYFQDTPLQGPVTQDKRATSHLASHTTPHRTPESSDLPNIPYTQDGVFKF